MSIRINSATAFDVWIDGTKHDFIGEPSSDLSLVAPDVFLVGQLRHAGVETWYLNGLVCAADFASGTQSDAVMATGQLESPLGSYVFGEHSGLTIYDRSGNANNLGVTTSNLAAFRSGLQDVYNPFKDGVGLFDFLGPVNIPRVLNSNVDAFLGLDVAATVGLLANGQRLLLDGGEPNSPFAQRCTGGRTFTRSEYVGDSGDHQQFANSNNEIVIYESAMSADLAAIVENQYT